MKKLMIAAYIAMTLSLGVAYAATGGSLVFNSNLAVDFWDPASMGFRIFPVLNENGDYFTGVDLTPNLSISDQTWQGTTFNVVIVKQGDNNGNTLPKIRTNFINTSEYAWTFCNASRVNLNAAYSANNIKSWSNFVPSTQYYTNASGNGATAQNLFDSGDPAYRIFTYAYNDGVINRPAQGGPSTGVNAPVTIYPNQTASVEIGFGGKAKGNWSETVWFRTYFKATYADTGLPVIDTNGQQVLRHFNFVITFVGSTYFSGVTYQNLYWDTYPVYPWEA